MAEPQAATGPTKGAQASATTGLETTGPETTGPEPWEAVVHDARPLTARSVIASTLLGVHPPRLPVAHLVRSGELFGIVEGTTRTALHRMVAAGELTQADSSYELAGHLLRRQRRQDESRMARTEDWDGRWEMAIVTGEGRDQRARSALRAATSRLRFAELREGVWLRPANLDPHRLPEDRRLLQEQCTAAHAELTSEEPSALAATLWPVKHWAAQAASLQHALRALQPSLDRGEVTDLAGAFVLAAGVLRHLQADPLLPSELLGPKWPGAALRADYEHFDVSFKHTWRSLTSTR